MNQPNFNEQLEYGKDFEKRFSKHLMNKSYFVIPMYLNNKESAPLLYGKNEKFILPDILAFREKPVWFECKRKAKMKVYPATGYPLHEHVSYKEVQKITNIKVFVVFEDSSLNNIWYGNWINELDKHIFKNNWNFEERKHIVFNYPEAFKIIKSPLHREAGGVSQTTT